MSMLEVMGTRNGTSVKDVDSFPTIKWEDSTFIYIFSFLF